MKANEPAYPLNHDPGTEYADGLTKREKLAMEIYANDVCGDLGNESWVIETAKRSLRAADIFFEQLEKNKMV